MRRRHPKPCRRCGGPKDFGARLYCAACRDAWAARVCGMEGCTEPVPPTGERFCSREHAYLTFSAERRQGEMVRCSQPGCTEQMYRKPARLRSHGKQGGKVHPLCHEHRYAKVPGRQLGRRKRVFAETCGHSVKWPGTKLCNECRAMVGDRRVTKEDRWVREALAALKAEGYRRPDVATIRARVRELGRGDPRHVHVVSRGVVYNVLKRLPPPAPCERPTLYRYQHHEALTGRSPCGPCTRKAQEVYHRNYLRRTGRLPKPGRRAWNRSQRRPVVHGTLTAIDRHRKDREALCDLCAVKWREYQREYARLRRARKRASKQGTS